MNTLNESLLQALIDDKRMCFEDDKPAGWLDRQLTNLIGRNDLDLLRAAMEVTYRHQFCEEIGIDVRDFDAWNRVMAKLAYRQG